MLRQIRRPTRAAPAGERRSAREHAQWLWLNVKPPQPFAARDERKVSLTRMAKALAAMLSHKAKGCK